MPQIHSVFATAWRVLEDLLAVELAGLKLVRDWGSR